MKISYYLARRIALTAFISVTLIAFGAAISAVTALDRYIDLSEQLKAVGSNLTSATVSGTSDGYWVKEYNEVIGVFSFDGRLEYTVDIFIRTLPKTDRELLKNGIFAKDNAELLEILGDYTS